MRDPGRLFWTGNDYTRSPARGLHGIYFAMPLELSGPRQVNRPSDPQPRTPSLLRFVGRQQDLSWGGWWSRLLSYRGVPFDRHDWFVESPRQHSIDLTCKTSSPSEKARPRTDAASALCVTSLTTTMIQLQATLSFLSM